MVFSLWVWVNGGVGPMVRGMWQGPGVCGRVWGDVAGCRGMW